MKKIAIVTGGADGIGKGIVEQFVKEGYLVAIVDRDTQKGIQLTEELNQEADVCKFYSLDVRDAEGIVSVMNEIKTLGNIEVLVNNAGFSRDSIIEEVTTEDWDDILNAHLRSSFIFIREVTPVMKKNRYGRIINISSISALGHKERPGYCAAKAGMHGLIKSVARELGEYDITANIVAPGFTVTNMTKISAERNHRTLQEHIRINVDALTIKRPGTPQDIANAVSFFASRRSGYITGQILYVSGNPD